MSSVVGFWWLPEEEAAFLDYLRKQGPITALPRRVVRGRDKLVAEDFDLVMSGDESTVLLTPVRYGGELVIAEGTDADGKCYSVDVRRSCVVSFTRGRIVAGNRLAKNNLHAYANYFGKDDEVVEKPLDFVKWYKRTFAWVRDRTPLWHQYKTYRITPAVADLVKNGWELVP